VHNLAVIENAVRIEGALHFAKRFIQRVAEHLPHERTAHQPIAMLPRERSAELAQLRDIVRDGLLPHALVGLHVDHRTNVQTPTDA
jgi:hypothetical protein